LEISGSASVSKMIGAWSRTCVRPQHAGPDRPRTYLPSITSSPNVAAVMPWATQPFAASYPFRGQRKPDLDVT
jgi:hypothetical protein